MTKRLGIVLLLLIGIIVSGREILHSEFVSGLGDLAGWTQSRGGDGSGNIRVVDAELSGSYRQPVLLNSGSGKSWTFLRRKLSSASLRGVESVRVTAWVRTPQPARLRLVLTEGYIWGEGAPSAFAESRGRNSNSRHIISVQLTRKSQQQDIGVAIGIDYESPNSWVVIDAIRIEALSSQEKPIEVPTVVDDYTRLVFPADIAGSNANVSSEKYAVMKATEERLWKQAGLMKDPAVVERLKNFTELLKILKLPATEQGKYFLEIQKRCQFVEQGQIFWQIKEDTYTFTESSLLSPVNSDKLHITLPGNAALDPLLLIGNIAPATQRFQLSVSGEAAKLIVPHLLVAADTVPDYPVQISSDTVIDVAPGSMRGLMLSCSSSGIAPGTYTGMVRLTPLAGNFEIKEMPISVEVLDHTLPLKMPLSVFNCDYTASISPQKRDILLDARVNVFHVALRSTEDFSPLKRLVTSLNERLKPNEYTLLIEIWFVRQANGWQENFNPWLDALVAEMQAMGLGYDNWILHIYDEVLDKQFLSSAAAIKKHNPSVRIFSDHIPEHADTVRQFQKYVDFWCPAGSTLANERFQASLAAMRDSGYPIWCYNAGAAPEQSPDVCRSLPWFAWKYRLNGVYMWAALTSSLRSRPNSQNYGLFYADHVGNWIPSRRWRQWRAGLEDYLLLEAVAAQGETGYQLARTAADEVTGSSNSQEREVIIAKWRSKLIEVLKP